jgi:hypothetical protein
MTLSRVLLLLVSAILYSILVLWDFNLEIMKNRIFEIKKCQIQKGLGGGATDFDMGV